MDGQTDVWQRIVRDSQKVWDAAAGVLVFRGGRGSEKHGGFTHVARDFKQGV